MLRFKARGSSEAQRREVLRYILYEGLAQCNMPWDKSNGWAKTLTGQVSGKENRWILELGFQLMLGMD